MKKLVPGRALAVAGVLCVLALVGAAVYLAKRHTPAHSIFVYCGSSFSLPTEEIAKNFESATGVKISFNIGGCETLMPSIEVSRKGDVFLCHEPFDALLRKQGLLADSVVVGRLTPVIVVAKGNPLKIASLDDLAKPGVRVGLMDARFATCGEMTMKALKDKGIEEAVRKNVKVEVRNHGDLANAIRVGQLDVAVVWNFIGTQFRDLDVVPTAEKFPQARILVCALTCAADRDAAAQFLKAAGSPAGRETFARTGYFVPEVKK